MRNEPKPTTAGYSPVIAVASVICNEGAVPLPYVLTLLGTIDAAFPELTFNEFYQAVVLSDRASRLPWGTA
jgi:hypothetical protein